MPLFFVRCRFFVNTFNRKKSNFDHFDPKKYFLGVTAPRLLDNNIAFGLKAVHFFYFPRKLYIALNCPHIHSTAQRCCFFAKKVTPWRNFFCPAGKLIAQRSVFFLFAKKVTPWRNFFCPCP